MNLEQTFILAPDRVEPLKSYIAGPMTGLPYFNFDEFANAERELKLHEIVTYNPATHDNEMGFNPFCFKTGDSKEPTCGNKRKKHQSQHEFSLREALKWDTARITESDLITLLPGWENSVGVRAELALAFALKIPVFELVESMCIKDSPELTEEQWIDSLQRTNKIKIQFVDDGDLSRLPGKEPYSFEKDAATQGFFDKLMKSSQSKDRDNTVGSTISPIDEYIAGTSYEASPPMELFGEVRATSTTGGQKGRKQAQFGLIPTGPLTQLAEHYGRGAEKYDANQWRAGYPWSWSYDALQRHANAFWSGEDFDEETGSNHMVAVAWHAFTLLEFYKNNKDQDDRYKP